MVEEYLDYDTPTTVTRDDFRQLMEDAKAGRFEVVLFTRLKDFLPEGVRETVRYLVDLIQLGVDFASLEEPEVSTIGTDARAARRLLALLATQENRRISTRIRAGMLRARREGQHIGRPRVDRALRKRIVELRRSGKTLRETAELVGVSESTVVKYQGKPVDDLLEQILR